MKKFKLTKLLLHGSSQHCSDFPNLPSIVNTDPNKIDRLIAIGDIHGDLDLAINCLLVARVIERVYDMNDNSNLIVTLDYKNEKIPRLYKWIGKKTIVIQVGDQVDRCRPHHNECTHKNETVNDEASDVTILFFFHDLHLAALNEECAVYSLLGNHEIMNVLGNLTYVSYKGLKQFGNAPNILEPRTDAFKLNSNELLYKNKTNLANFLACTRLSIIIVNQYLFVHAGVLDKLITNILEHDSNASNISPIELINNMVQSWLLNATKNEDKNYVIKLLAGTNLSPFWPRVFGNLAPNLSMNSAKCQHNVQPVLDLLGIKGIVVGHTPQLGEGINSTCDNAVWRVDIAGSQAFEKIIYMNAKYTRNEIKENRRPQVLEIILGKNGLSDSFNVLI